MKQNERPTAIAALILAILGLLCFMLSLFPSYDQTDTFIILFVIFFILAFVIGGISLFIKSSAIGWIAFVIGGVFGLGILILVLMMQDMCVVC